MLKSIKKDRDGFTIIEVLIVLAIAALILVIVFLAVPSLQRSARNTQRRTDVSAIIASISNYISNNNGVLPNQIAISGTTATISCATAGTGLATGCTAGNTETATMGFYGGSAPQITSAIGAVSPNYTVPTTAQFLYDPGASCTGNAPTATAGSFVILYSPEGGSTTDCLS
jgi:prepilin-type N-terminal cleavage/methylation domain-containing protein